MDYTPYVWPVIFCIAVVGVLFGVFNTANHLHRIVGNPSAAAAKKSAKAALEAASKSRAAATAAKATADDAAKVSADAEAAVDKAKAGEEATAAAKVEEAKAVAEKAKVDANSAAQKAKVDTDEATAAKSRADDAVAADPEPIDNFTKFMTCFVSIAAVLGMLVYMALVLYIAVFGAQTEQLKGILSAPLVNVGLPVAVVASLALVALLPLTTTSTEPLEIEGLGLTIKGPAAQIVLWAMCFVVIIGGMVAVSALSSKESKAATAENSKK
jgi:hypothetical protein